MHGRRLHGFHRTCGVDVMARNPIVLDTGPLRHGILQAARYGDVSPPCCHLASCRLLCLSSTRSAPLFFDHHAGRREYHRRCDSLCRAGAPDMDPHAVEFPADHWHAGGDREAGGGPCYPRPLLRCSTPDLSFSYHDVPGSLFIDRDCECRGCGTSGRNCGEFARHPIGGTRVIPTLRRGI